MVIHECARTSTGFLGVGAERLPRGPGKEDPGSRGTGRSRGLKVELESSQAIRITEHLMPRDWGKARHRHLEVSAPKLRQGSFIHQPLPLVNSPACAGLARSTK